MGNVALTRKKDFYKMQWKGIYVVYMGKRDKVWK